MTLLLMSSWRFFRRHPGQLLLALTGVAAGVAMVTGVALMRDVLLWSLDEASIALAGEDNLRISHRSGLIDQQQYLALALQAGAPALLPVLEATVRVADERLRLIALDVLAVAESQGGGLSLAGPATGQLLTRRDAVVMTQRTFKRLKRAGAIAVNKNGPNREATVSLHHRGQSHTLTIVSLIEDQRTLDNHLITDLAVGQRLLDQPGALSHLLAPANAADWLATQAVDGLQWTPQRDRQAASASLTAGMRANLSAMSLLSLAVGLFVIYSVLAFLLVQRRRSFGMLRAIGVSADRITMTLMVETLLLAGLGTLLGLVVGTIMADGLLTLIRQPVAELYQQVPARGITPSLGLYASVALISLTMALLSVSSVLREARHISPGQLVRDSAARAPQSDRWQRWLAGSVSVLGLIMIGVAAGRGQPLSLALAGLFLLLAGCALLAPQLGLWALGRWPSRAAVMLVEGRQRLMPALAALSLALALSAGIGMMVLGFRVAVDQWVDQLLRADVYVTSHDAALDGARMDEVTHWPGVTAVTSVRQVTLSNGLALLAYDLNDSAWRGFHWLAGDPDQARESFMAGEALIVTEALARRQGWRLGEVIDVPSPSGSLRLPIAGIYQDYSSDQGTLAMNGARYRQHWQDDQRDSLGVTLHPETNVAELRTWLDNHPHHAGITLTTRETIREQTMAVFDRTFRISWAMAVLVALIASVALISALLALGLERARDYATLRALGMDQAHLRRFVRWQTTALAGTAALLAVPMAMLIHVVLSQVIQPLAFGWRIAFNLPMVPLALMFGLALALGLMAGLYPGWAIARRDPAPLLRSGNR